MMTSPSTDGRTQALVASGIVLLIYMCACVLLALADRFLQSKAICHFILGFCVLSIRFDGRLKTVAIIREE